jgi:hypothetical protein
MCFGLSEAYGFSYWIDRTSKIPCLIMLGRTKLVLETFFNKFEIPFEYNMIDGEPDFELHTTKTLLEKNVVLAYADRYYLKHLEKKYNRAHFGNHLISVVGYKKIDNVIKYAINDVIDDNVVWCTSDEIQTARLSSWKPFPPDGQVVDICINGLTLKQYADRIPELTIQSILNISNSMLINKDSGVNALKALSFEIKYLLDADMEKYGRAIKFQLRLIASFIREFEETHTFYRLTFSEFLFEASDKYGMEYLSCFVPKMKDIAVQWFTMSKLIENSEDITAVLSDISVKLSVLSDMEKAFFEELRQLILNRQNSI